MPPKVSSLFSTGKTKPNDYTRKQVQVDERVDDFDCNVSNEYEKQLKSIIKVEETKRPKYILAALEKADERKAIADMIKNIRNEKEIKKLEKEQGKFLKFYTNVDGKDVVFDEDVHIDDNEIDDDTKDDEIKEIDFEGMKERYLKRMEEKDILKLNIEQKKLDLIVNFANLIKENNL